MRIYNPFKKKKIPINEGHYDWKFQHVSGGFCYLHKLRKRKPAYILIWLGGLKFKFFKVYKSLPTAETPNPTTYSTILNFSPEFINDLKSL